MNITNDYCYLCYLLFLFITSDLTDFTDFQLVSFDGYLLICVIRVIC